VKTNRAIVASSRIPKMYSPMMMNNLMNLNFHVDDIVFSIRLRPLDILSGRIGVYHRLQLLSLPFTDAPSDVMHQAI
jgi:hypothetical protein